MRARGAAWVLAVLAAARLAAQDSTRAAHHPTPAASYRNRLLGAYDAQSGDPIEGLEVIDVASGTTALTTKTGTVSLAFLPDGGSLVRLRKLGYAPVTMNVAISPADTSPLTIVMKRAAQELPAVVTKDSARRYISPGLQGFEERRRGGLGGHFIDEDAFRKMDGDILANVLRRLPGATLNGGSLVTTRGGTSAPVLLNPPSSGKGCPVAVYENGIRIKPAPDFNRVRVDDFAAAEFYPGPETYPIWISPTNNDCGVLLLWFRER